MEPIIREVQVKSVLTKSNLPVSDYSVNPYVGCTHGCRYCYANRGRGPAGGHNPQSPLLTGELGPEDVIKEKILQSCQLDQQSLY